MICRLCSLLCVLVCLGSTVTLARADATDGAQVSDWTVERDTDPILDSPNITAQLRETGVKRSLFGLEKSFVLRCVERKLDVFVVWGNFGVLGLSLSGTSPFEVVWRFNHATPQTEKWAPSRNYNATFSPQPREFLRLLAQHQGLAVRTFPRDGGSLTAVFDLTEAKQIVAEVNAACRDDARLGEADSPPQDRAALHAQQLEKERRALLDAGRTAYIAQIKAKIERNWLRPPGTALGLKCVVRISQIPDGEVVQAEIQTGSGNIAFDRSVEDAVLRSSPLPVPADPSLFDRNIVIIFEPES